MAEQASPFLVRLVVELDGGEVLCDQTVVCDVAEFCGVEQAFWLFGQAGRIRVVFDPPLRAAASG